MLLQYVIVNDITIYFLYIYAYIFYSSEILLFLLFHIILKFAGSLTFKMQIWMAWIIEITETVILTSKTGKVVIHIIWYKS